MVNFERLQKELKKYDEEREKLIKKSRDVLKLTKQAIYAVHRSEMELAKSLISDLEKERRVLDKIAMHDAKMAYEGSYKVAMQEYVEAALFYEFVRNGKLAEINVLAEHYILGLCDLPGELGRRAVYLAGKGEVQEVSKILGLIDNIYGEMLKFDFRDNEIRRKVDSIKYELKKMEDLVLNLKMSGRVNR